MVDQLGHLRVHRHLGQLGALEGRFAAAVIFSRAQPVFMQRQGEVQVSEGGFGLDRGRSLACLPKVIDQEAL
jgi:hypothetical protein